MIMKPRKLVRLIKVPLLLILCACIDGTVNAQSDHERIVALEALVERQNERLVSLEFMAMPVGTITAFAGPVNRIPPDWMLCDGSTLNKNNEPKLFNRIGTMWGGTGQPDFKLPDLRGRFLRGVDGGSTLDPDLAGRTVQNPSCTPAEMGICRNSPGSLQADATKKPNKDFETGVTGQHSHLSVANFDRALAYDGQETIHETDGIGGGQEPNLKDSKPLVAAGDHKHIIATGGDNETRPKNAYVLWIIRVR
jgi:microcystin-dependent protein